MTKTYQDLPRHPEEYLRALQTTWNHALQVDTTENPAKVHDRTSLNLLHTNLGRPSFSATAVPDWPSLEVRNRALSPVGALPQILRSISPKLALQMLNASARSFDIHSSTLHLLGYGSAQDQILNMLQREPVIPRPFKQLRSSERKIGSNLIRELLKRGSDRTFPTLVAEEPVLWDELGDLPKQATELANAVDFPEEAAQYSSELVFEDEVRHAVTHLPWPFYVEDTDNLRLTLAARLTLALRFPSATLYTVKAEQLLNLSLAVGVTPTAFLKYAVEDLQRRKVTYITPQEVDKLVELTCLQTPPEGQPAGLRAVFLKQVKSAANSYHDAVERHRRDTLVVRATLRSTHHETLLPEIGWARPQLIQALRYHREMYEEE